MSVTVCITVIIINYNNKKDFGWLRTATQKERKINQLDDFQGGNCDETEPTLCVSNYQVM